MEQDKKLQISLLGLRLGVASVMFAWAIDRVMNYEHNSGMISHYYKLDIGPSVLTAIGIAQLIILTGFLVGRFKTLTYGYVLIAHLIATIASSYKFFPPYEKHQLLYFAALPMLAACFALFMMRDRDTLLNI